MKNINLQNEFKILKNIFIFLLIIFCLFITILNAIINNLYKEIDILKEEINTQYKIESVEKII